MWFVWECYQNQINSISKIIKFIQKWYLATFQLNIMITRNNNINILIVNIAYLPFRWIHGKFALNFNVFR